MNKLAAYGIGFGIGLVIVFAVLGFVYTANKPGMEIREPNPEGWSQAQVNVVAQVYMAVKGLNAKRYVRVQMLGSPRSYEFRMLEFGKLGLWGTTTSGERAFVPYQQIAALSGE